MGIEELPEGSPRERKVEALAKDFLEKGKSLEWIIENVAGKNFRHRRIVISAAEFGRYITSAAAIEARKKYCPKKKED